VTDPMNELRDGLSFASKEFEKSEILGAMAALEAVMKFVQNRVPDRAAIVPLTWLSMKLADEALERQGKSLFDATRLGIVSGFIDLLKLEGIKVNDAAQMIARKSNGVTAAKLLEFRKNVGKGRASADAIESRRVILNLRNILDETPDRETRIKAVMNAVENLFCT